MKYKYMFLIFPPNCCFILLRLWFVEKKVITKLFGSKASRNILVIEYSCMRVTLATYGVPVEFICMVFFPFNKNYCLVN